MSIHQQLYANKINKELLEKLVDAREAYESMSDKEIYEKQKKINYTKGRKFLLLCFVVVVVFLLTTFYVGEYYKYDANKGSRSTFQPSFKAFTGFPSENVFLSICVGMMLGVVFGFLDNFGLFYGMDYLNPFFYDIASKMMAPHVIGENYNSLVGDEKVNRLKQLHSLSDGMMNGLGNTFSDLLGVFLGSAVLASAKSSFGIESNFWPIDIFAIVLGCLIGAYIPALMKEGKGKSKKIGFLFITLFIISILLCMFVPSYNNNTRSTVIVSLFLAVCALLLFIMIYNYTRGSFIRNKILKDVSLEPDNKVINAIDSLINTLQGS